jgi:hypothetical protein
MSGAWDNASATASVEDLPVAETANAGASGTANAEDAQLSAWLLSVREKLQKLSAQVADIQQSAQFGPSEIENPRAEASLSSPVEAPGGNTGGFSLGVAEMSSSYL